MCSREVTQNVYNRYLDPGGQTVSFGTPSPPQQPEENSSPPPHQKAAQKPADLLGEVTSGLGDFLSGFLKKTSLSNLDSGDILLALIILFLFLEGDNLELVITLGLMLLLGLGED